MERLGYLIQDAVDKSLWKPIKPGWNGPYISHLFFADDLFLFGRASVHHTNVFKDILDKFYDASGAKVSFEKSKFFISPSSRSGSDRRFGQIVNMSATSELGKYLGVSLIHSRVSKSVYCEIVDKDKLRLYSWKASSLSAMGRTILISSVTSAVPTYIMMTSKLPSSIVNEIDKHGDSNPTGQLVGACSQRPLRRPG
ncbi:uncharacterized protein LOC120198755 [Hibiscus syriacus]|uniref:uncharacterized protein LOC120198755 n=1 Tax=Hibiscus syriacus TaxID=106335 RepID=UPI001920A8B4|nr:uncharacterized protein LOC120198755 [Hibiscus syriacus]